MEQNSYTDLLCNPIANNLRKNNNEAISFKEVDIQPHFYKALSNCQQINIAYLISKLKGNRENYCHTKILQVAEYYSKNNSKESVTQNCFNTNNGVN